MGAVSIGGGSVMADKFVSLAACHKRGDMEGARSCHDQVVAWCADAACACRTSHDVGLACLHDRVVAIHGVCDAFSPHSSRLLCCCSLHAYCKLARMTGQ